MTVLAVENPFRTFMHRIFRTKTVSPEQVMDTQLSRCLSTFDITLLGIGHMIGAGIYVMTGDVARNTAGPAIIFSFIIAGFASLLAALCYAEFGAKLPKAGSAYSYTYLTVGEFWAFVIGWNIILEHMISAAALARAWSGYLDSMLGHVIRNSTVTYVGRMEGTYMDYPDFVAFLMVLIVSGFLGFGAKSSVNFNTILTVVNLAVIIFVIIYGFTFAQLENWSLFFPYKFSGVIAGAASCFFAFIGFDGIATSGEEASDPAKSIPRATLIAMAITTLGYFLMSCSLTLMVRFDHIFPESAFADAFEQRGAVWAKYVVAIGAICGMTTSLVGSLFALPRCVYAMADDGLIFRWLAHVHPSSQVPTLAIAIFGLISAIIALLFDVDTLVQFLSIGTLMAYTIVSCSVIVLRYRPEPGSPDEDAGAKVVGIEQKGVAVIEKVQSENDVVGLITEQKVVGKLKPGYLFLRPVFDRLEPGTAVCASVFAMTVIAVCWGAIFNYGGIDEGRWYSIMLSLLFGLLFALCYLLICAHQQSADQLKFKVPAVPAVPTLSILVNVVLMMHLHPITWMRLLIWLSVGLLVYFFYGIRNSSEAARGIPRELSSLLSSSAAQTPLHETFHMPQPGAAEASKQRS